MLTAAGSGYSRWRDLAVTRWREDATCDDWGSYIYLRDVESDRLWSATYQPTSARPDQYSSRVQRGAGDFLAPGRRSPYDARSGRLDRGRRRGSSSHHHQQRQAGSRDRGHLLCRDRHRLARRTTAPTRPSPRCPSRREYVARFGAILATRRRRSPDQLGSLGGASFGRFGRRCGKGGVRDRPRPLPRPRARRSDAGRGDRRTPPVALDRSRARSGLRAAPAGPPRAGRSRAHRLLDVGRRVPGRAARRRRQDQRHQRVRPGGHARLDPGAGAAPSSRHRSGRGERVPAPRRTSHLCRALAAAVLGSDHARRRTAIRPVAAEHLGRPADHPAAHRERRGHQDRSPAAAGHGILAGPQARGGPRHHQRTRFLLRPGPAIGARDRLAHQPGVAARIRPRARRDRCSCCAPISLPPRDLRVAGVGRARSADGRRGRARRAAQPHQGARPSPRARLASLPCGPLSRRPRPTPSSSSSTASAGLRTDGREYVDHPRPRPVDSRALDQRHRQPGLRISGVGRRLRLYLVGQQPGASADSLVERSGYRPPGRSHLPARRGERRALVPDGAAHSRRSGRLCRPARLGLQPVRA